VVLSDCCTHVPCCMHVPTSPLQKSVSTHAASPPPWAIHPVCSPSPSRPALLAPHPAPPRPRIHRTARRQRAAPNPEGSARPRAGRAARCFAAFGFRRLLRVDGGLPAAGLPELDSGGCCGWMGVYPQQVYRSWIPAAAAGGWGSTRSRSAGAGFRQLLRVRATATSGPLARAISRGKERGQLSAHRRLPVIHCQQPWMARNAASSPAR
jgi:hypothetical protein